MVTMIKQAVILVGGKGTRLRPLTETKPKPILPVLDRPCLKYLIQSFVDAGIEEVILACGYRSDQLVSVIGDGSDMGISIEYSYEDEPRGTAGAIKMIEDRLDDVFVAANGDVFAEFAVKGEIEKHIQTGSKVTISLTSVKNPCEFGIVRLDETERIVEFKEKPKPEEVFSDLINAGVYVIDKSVLKYIPANVFFDLSKDLFPILLSKGDRMQGHIINGVWKDVGRPSDLMVANIIMATRKYDGYLWGGKNIQNTDIRKPFYIGNDARLENSSVSASVIMMNSKIINSKITNSLIMSGCVVIDAVIENSILGDGCIVEAGSVVSNAVLGDGTEIKENEIVNEKEVK